MIDAPPTSAGVIGIAEFARLMQPLMPDGRGPRPHHICCAVSGGADSMALTLLAARWAARRQIAITALSVDHGLRRRSKAEARKVGFWLSERGIAHKVLTWRGAKPQSNIQARAREARYRLLGDWCRRHGVQDLLLGHHQDDQAETVILRLMRGSGVDGLAAMAPLTMRDGLRILRPLLGVPKARLTATCAKFKQPWIEDPSNRDDQFARVRVRKLMAEFEAEGLTSMRLAATAGRMAQARAALDGAAFDLLSSSVRMYPQGYAEIDTKPLSASPREIGLRALSMVLKHVGGAGYAPRFDRLNSVFDALRQNDLTRGRTLAGCHLAGQTDVVRVIRELRHIDRMALKAGAGVLWDGRFDVRLRKRRGVDADGLSVAAMGRAGWSDIRRQIRENERRNFNDTPPPILPSRVRQTLPALWRGADLLAVPHLGFAREATGRAFCAEFRFPHR